MGVVLADHDVDLARRLGQDNVQEEHRVYTALANECARILLRPTGSKFETPPRDLVIPSGACSTLSSTAGAGAAPLTSVLEVSGTAFSISRALSVLERPL